MQAAANLQDAVVCLNARPVEQVEIFLQPSADLARHIEDLLRCLFKNGDLVAKLFLDKGRPRARRLGRIIEKGGVTGQLFAKLIGIAQGFLSRFIEQRLPLAELLINCVQALARRR